MTNTKKELLKECFDRFNHCRGITDQELEEMIELVDTALFYLELKNSGNLLIGVQLELESLKKCNWRRSSI